MDPFEIVFRTKYSSIKEEKSSRITVHNIVIRFILVTHSGGGGTFPPHQFLWSNRLRFSQFEARAGATSAKVVYSTLELGKRDLA